MENGIPTTYPTYTYDSMLYCEKLKKEYWFIIKYLGPLTLYLTQQQQQTMHHIVQHESKISS